MRRFWKDALLYLLAHGLSGVALAFLTFWLLKTTYAGVSDEATVQAGVSAYRTYLRSLGWSIVGLDVLQLLALATVTCGLVAFRTLAARPRPLPMLVGVAILTQLAWLGSQAGRRPGLFLTLLGTGWLGPRWVIVSAWVWLILLSLSLAGLARVAVAPSERRDRFLACACVCVSLAWIWFFERPHGERLTPRPHTASASAAPKPRPLPNVLLIGVDSLRPDKIDERKSPVLARLCREAVYFPNTLVTIARTAPSWSALLTSLPPLGNGVETMFPTAARSRLASFAMPAHLASMGYATHVSSEYAGEFFGRVLLGFEDRAVPRVELEQMLGQGLLARQPAAQALAGELYSTSSFVRRILPAPLPELMRGLASFSHPYVVGADFVERFDPSRPWFTLLFYSQPHFPYTSSRPYYDLYGVPGSDASLRFAKDATRGEVKSEADRAQVESLYRSALAETDAAVGDLLSRLESSGDLEDTIVILTADHGEGLYECSDCVGHGDNLRGMMSLRVPLAFRLPKRRFPAASPAVVSAYVSQLDVYPTVLGLLGIPRPAVQEGLALLRSDGAPAPLPEHRIFFAETGEWLWPTGAVPVERITYPPITSLAAIEEGRVVIDERYLPVIRAAKHRAAILPPYKLVYRPKPKAVEWLLYDIVRDPLEEHDLARREPEVIAKLRSALIHSVLRFPRMLAEGDYFLSRPAPPGEEYY